MECCCFIALAIGSLIRDFTITERINWCSHRVNVACGQLGGASIPDFLVQRTEKMGNGSLMKLTTLKHIVQKVVLEMLYSFGPEISVSHPIPKLRR